jgi:hypothetical protein
MADKSDKITLADGEAAFIAVVSTALGVPIPATVSKNLLQGLGALIGGGFDVGVAWLEGIASDIRAETRAREKLTLDAVEIAADQIRADPALAKRATLAIGRRLLRAQETREKIAHDVVEDLKHNPPKEEASGHTDDDWFDLFARHAETKTNADMQAYFAKVLSGELRRPGSFSPETIEVLSRLSPKRAKLFQDYCGLSMELRGQPGMAPFVLAEPFGAPGNNSLSDVGFPYLRICDLQDAGLVRPDVTAYQNFPPLLLSLAAVGCRFLNILPASTDQKPSTRAAQVQRLSTLFFTQAGAELRTIVHMTPNEAYIAKLLSWLEQFELRPRTSGQPWIE